MPTPEPSTEQDMPHFAPATRRWFSAAFAAPTAVQSAAWQAIAEGHHSLVIAPTGSGKTLAAFLYAIDALFRERAAATPPHGAVTATRTRILYISPVKALAVDVQRNLQMPLAGVEAERRKCGEPEIEIRIGMRSGDTSVAERAKLVRRPPDILITTPESLFLMLTSNARTTLRDVTTVIVDEVHAVAGNKRGAQLAVCLERLDLLLAKPAQRIGLSATVRPVERVAHFLGGSHHVEIVNPAAQRTLDLKIVVPVADMGDLMGSPDPAMETGQDAAGTGSIWPHIEAAILQQVLARRTTLVFTNSRGLAEKLTARLNERYARQFAEADGASRPMLNYHSASGGTETRSEGLPALLARSHHGSVSKEQRLQTEAALKAGELRCVVATSSLELGIDMGHIDLVIQVGAPPSVASGLQRVGRAGHQVGGTSSGVFYPRTRRDLLEATVMINAMRAAELEAIEPPHHPLDILAQQTVAAVAMETLNVDDRFATLRRSDPLRNLPRSAFEATLDMLSGKYPSDDFSQFRPRLIWDRHAHSLSPRPGAQHLAVTSGGTIPDRGMFSVMLPESEEQSGARRVGELDEEMVYESRVNDIITLGASSWRIQQITHDQVIVIPAPGRSARLPFWHGEGTGRAAMLGEKLGAFLRHAATALGNDAIADQITRQWQADGLDQAAADNLLEFIRQQQEATGVLPHDRLLVIEHCRDESGDWRIILHSPYGQRVHRPWALAIAERIRHQLGLDPAVVSSDDGIVVRLPDTDGRIPDDGLFLFDPDKLQRSLSDAVVHSALFAARFRECAARSLLLPKRNPGKRTPLWQQRLRAGQLLDIARQYADFPVLLETLRECLQDVYDLPALHHLMTRIQRNEIQLTQVTTDSPSPFAATLLFGYVGEFIYASDTPLAERRASLLTLDSQLLSELMGETAPGDLLDPKVISQVARELQRTDARYQATDTEGIADLLRELGPLSTAEIEQRFRADEHHAADSIASLQQTGRIFAVRFGDVDRWALIEDAARLRDALGVRLPASIPHPLLTSVAHPLADLVNRYARSHPPFTTLQLAQYLGLGSDLVISTLEQLRTEGKVLTGNFGLLPQSPAPGEAEHPPSSARQWVAAGVFRRLRVRSLQAAREATQPVPSPVYVRLLLDRHGVLSAGAGQTSDRVEVSSGRYQGSNGVASVIEQLAGVALPVQLWENQIFPARVQDYQPAMLDELLASGEAIWVGHKMAGNTAGLVSLHLSELAAETLPPGPDITVQTTLTSLQQAVLQHMENGGAYFIHQLYAQCAQGG